MVWVWLWELQLLLVEIPLLWLGFDGWLFVWLWYPLVPLGADLAGEEGPNVRVVLLNVLFLSLECLGIEVTGSEVPVLQVLWLLCGDKVGDIKREVVLVCLEKTVALLAE